MSIVVSFEHGKNYGISFVKLFWIKNCLFERIRIIKPLLI